MIGLDISEILPDFPETRVALVVARDIEVVPARAPALERARKAGGVPGKSGRTSDMSRPIMAAPGSRGE